MKRDSHPNRVLYKARGDCSLKRRFIFGISPGLFTHNKASCVFLHAPLLRVHVCSDTTINKQRVRFDENHRFVISLQAINEENILMIRDTTTIDIGPLLSFMPPVTDGCGKLAYL